MTTEPIIESRAVEPFHKNAYILACPDSLIAIYIDPGDEADLLLEWVDERKLQLAAIVNTHSHLDHISGVGRVKARWDVPIYLHPEALPLYQRLPQEGHRFGFRFDPPPPVDRELSEAEVLQFGSLRIQVHYTPGHAPGHVCLEVGRHVFCGDAIFAGSIGRTDLGGGSLEVLMRSIQEKILPLGDEKILHPGHGPQTTIGQEKRTNPFLLQAGRS